MIVEFLSQDNVIVRHKDSINSLVITFDRDSLVVSAQDTQDCEEHDEYLGS